VLRRISTVCLAASLGLAGCGGVDPKTFEGEEPRFVLEDFFRGKTEAHGIFEDRFGKLRRRFAVDIDGTWDAEAKTLTLDERFVYADGETDRRVWTIEKQGPHRYRGTAGDVIGAAEGRSYGPAFTWAYDIDLDVGESTWRVRFKDWLYKMDENVVINRASVTRWGIEIGTLTIVFRRPGE
jgi:hypothetical protein